MTDHHVQARLSAYVSGQCSPAERRRITAHLAECPACRTALERHQRTAADLRFALHSVPTPDLWQGVQAAQARPPRRVPWGAAVPVLVLLIILTMPLTLPFWAGVGYTAPPVSQSATPTLVADALPEAAEGRGTLIATRAQTTPEYTVRGLLTPVPQPPE